MQNLQQLLTLLLLLFSYASGFGLKRMCVRQVTKSPIQMGLFDFLGPKKSASASHILMKGEKGLEKLNSLKAELSRSKNLPEDFATAAAEYSACPSSKRGGALGTFKQGQMVPAFDKVVFNEAIGVVHGPVKTPFGAHLILIESRSD